MSTESRLTTAATGVSPEIFKGLHELLRAAAVDGFAGIMAEGLGPRLRAVADDLLAGSSLGTWHDQLRHFRGGLDRFEERGQHDRSRVVAHGLRIVAAVRASAPQEPQRRSKNRDLGPARRSTRRPLPRAHVPAAPTNVVAPADEALVAKTGKKTTAKTGKKAAAKTGKKAAARTGKKAAKTGKKTAKRTGKKRSAASEGSPESLPVVHSQVSEEALARRHALALSSLQQLPGIGAKTAEKLIARGIESIEDLAFLLPKRYEDRRHRWRLDHVIDGEFAAVEATIRSFRQGYFRGRYLATLEVEQEREEGPPLALKARWFHRVGGLLQRIETGKKICLFGTIKWFRGECSMVHPEARDADDPGPAIALRYPEIEGIGQASLARYCRAALAHL
ncbi:MAG TPA: hypothetical protein ENJ18_17985, partial [Nannocystis exedens]|nr:hypothetical protein [Nannocystis exedens]